MKGRNISAETKWSDVERWMENLCPNCGNTDVQDYILGLHQYRERTRGWSQEVGRNGIGGGTSVGRNMDADDIAKELGLE